MRVYRRSKEFYPTGKTILVVDDDADYRTIAAALLVYAGHDAVEAPSVAAAEEILWTTPVDLILLDISMPNKNGLEWALELRSRPEMTRIPIVAYTSFRDVFGVIGLRTPSVAGWSWQIWEPTVGYSSFGAAPLEEIHAA